MRSWPDRAWGKFDAGTDGVPQWHPLIDHCADVASCCEALLRQPLINRRMATLAGLSALEETLIARLSVLAFLHDIGKANRGFQRKILPDLTHSRAGHVKELYWLFSDKDDLALRAGKTLCMEDVSSWFTGQTGSALLIGSISHHGAPWNCKERAGRRDWWLPDGAYDPMATLRQMGDRLQQWFPDAFRPCAPLDAPSEFQHAFAGLVMLADWLGSDRRMFPYSEESDGDRMSYARKAALQALRAVGLADNGSRAALAQNPGHFGILFDHPVTPNTLQKAIGSVAPSPLMIMESETGSGKTEAAFWYFKRLFEAGEVDGLYFALPTRAAATQLHRRVTEMVARLFPQEARPAVVLAVPGYFRVDDVVGRALPEFKVLWDDDPGKSEPRFWAAENPKRYLAARIAVGTIDQVLLSALKVRHAHLRSTALMRHLLVVDEVHASDPYMNRLLEAVLDNHLGAGGYTLLMSATLGSAAQARFLGGVRAKAPPPEVATAAPYPQLSWRDGMGTGVLPIATDRPEKSVAIEISPAMEEAGKIAEAAYRAAQSGAKILVIRNTVDAAMATQQALEALCGDTPSSPLFRCKGSVSLHHGRFARDDRKLLDEAVEAQIGKNRADGGLVVIGTQTLEQSLDIDADLLITDLCPMDVLLQRIGRLHRHARDSRPQGFKTPRVIVLRPAERSLSPGQRGLARYGLGGYVYPDLRVLEATLRLLEEHACLDIPAMNREVVERATHPDCLDALAAELGPDWEKHGRNIAGAVYGERGMAAIHLIQRDTLFDETRFPGREEKIGTRLGTDDRLIDWGEGVTPPSGPFGLPARHLVIPAHLCRGIAPDAVARPMAVGEAGFRFQLDNEYFAYDRLGLRKEQIA